MDQFCKRFCFFNSIKFFIIIKVVLSFELFYYLCFLNLINDFAKARKIFIIFNYFHGTDTIDIESSVVENITMVLRSMILFFFFADAIWRFLNIRQLPFFLATVKVVFLIYDYFRRVLFLLVLVLHNLLSYYFFTWISLWISNRNIGFIIVL